MATACTAEFPSVAATAERNIRRCIGSELRSCQFKRQFVREHAKSGASAYRPASSPLTTDVGDLFW
jgi:hypothetical protein